MVVTGMKTILLVCVVTFISHNFISQNTCFSHDEASFELVLSLLVSICSLLSTDIPTVIIDISCVYSSISGLGFRLCSFGVAETMSDHELFIFLWDSGFVTKAVHFSCSWVPSLWLGTKVVLILHVQNFWPDTFGTCFHINRRIEKLVILRIVNLSISDASNLVFMAIRVSLCLGSAIVPTHQYLLFLLLKSQIRNK